MGLLTRQEIISAEDFETKDIEVPEWGGTVRIKTISGTERDEFEASTVKMKNGRSEQNMENFRARFLSLCIIDEDGKRLFPNKTDIQYLGRKSVKALQRVFNAAQELNSMTDEDVDGLTEDFDKDRDEDSTSD